jgi:hypothetical protein
VSVLMHATSLGSAPTYIVSLVTTSAIACHTNDLSKEWVDVVRHVRPLALVRVVEVPFDSSDRRIHICTDHDLLCHPHFHFSIDELSRSLAHEPKRVAAQVRARFVICVAFRQWPVGLQLTSTTLPCSELSAVADNRLVRRERELCAGSHGWMWC